MITHSGTCPSCGSTDQGLATLSCPCQRGDVGSADGPAQNLSSPPASSVSGGPAHANATASPAARVIDPDEAVTGFRAAMTDRSEKAISGETLIRDINALLSRGDRALTELAAIQCELAMMRKDLGDLYGLPID